MLKSWGSVLVAMGAAGAMLFASASVAQNSCDTDFNGDGTTDPADFEILKAAFGSAEGDAAYVAAVDLNQDGHVTTLDYQIMLGCN